MPGDEYSDSISISNTTREKATVLFKTDFEESRLLNMMQMNIDNGSSFYTGPVAGDSLKEYREIAVLSPGEEREIEITVTLPDTADNSYQVMDDKATWYFAINQNMENAVKTGDDILLMPWTAICPASIVIILLVLRKRKNINEEDI